MKTTNNGFVVPQPISTAVFLGSQKAASGFSEQMIVKGEWHVLRSMREDEGQRDPQAEPQKKAQAPGLGAGCGLSPELTRGQWGSGVMQQAHGAQKEDLL
jgi:hypothetical protein